MAQDKTYNTVSSFEIFANDNGRSDIFTSSNTSTTAAVNGTFNDTVTVITYDGLSGSIVAGDYIRIEQEIILVVSLTATDLTVTRGQHGSTAVAIVDDSVITKQDLEKKIQVILAATSEIEALHRQPRDSSTDELWLDTDTDLIRYSNELSIHIYDVFCQRKVATNILTITNGAFSDGNLSVDNATEGYIPKGIKSKLLKLFFDHEVGGNRLQRA